MGLGCGGWYGWGTHDESDAKETTFINVKISPSLGAFPCLKMPKNQTRQRRRQVQNTSVFLSLLTTWAQMVDDKKGAKIALFSAGSKNDKN